MRKFLYYALTFSLPGLGILRNFRCTLLNDSILVNFEFPEDLSLAFKLLSEKYLKRKLIKIFIQNISTKQPNILTSNFTFAPLFISTHYISTYIPKKIKKFFFAFLFMVQ